MGPAHIVRRSYRAVARDGGRCATSSRSAGARGGVRAHPARTPPLGSFGLCGNGRLVGCLPAGVGIVRDHVGG